jgi:arginase
VRLIRVPFHLDDFLPNLDFPLGPGTALEVSLPSSGDIWKRLAALYSAVGDAVSDAAASAETDCPVVLSGDCITALGTMAGLQRAGIDAGIVWFDAHGDVQTPETTTSGYLAGMSLRLLSGYRPELIAARLGLRPVPEQRIVLVGARDLDPPEVAYLSGARIRQVGEVADLVAADAPDCPLYVHLDLDVIDPGEVPGLRYPTPGGPGVAQVASALRMLLRTGRVVAVGVACSWYPGHATARVGPALESAFAAWS